MSRPIIILAGVANSGKTTTIKRLIAKHLRKVSLNVYLLDHKSICLRVSSPQEWALFCNYKGAMRIIRRLLARCAARSGSLVVMPFTLQFKPDINRHCIERPIRELRRSGYDVHLVYLRRSDVGGLSEADGLMKELGARVIQSDKKWDRQAEDLWKVITRIDP